jgi:hypothetical protein
MTATAARVLPIELRAKLAPLLRLQSSANDGERANASAAIGRPLQRHGLDWHDLVDVLLAESAPVPPPPSPPRGTSWKRTDGPAELPRDQLLELIDLIEAANTRLSTKSSEFLDSLRERSFGRPITRLSEKQWRWLQDSIEETGI